MKTCEHALNHPCNIVEYEYDEQAQTLFLRFKHGTEKTHQGVPPEVYAAFDADRHPGRFYAKHIQMAYGVA